MEIINLITEKIVPFGSSVTALIISNLYFSVQATSKIVCNFVSYSILLSREINLKVQSQYNVRARERLPEKKAKFLEIGCDEIPVPFAVLQGY